jgi:hypothetical protein
MTRPDDATIDALVAEFAGRLPDNPAAYLAALEEFLSLDAPALRSLRDWPELLEPDRPDVAAAFSAWAAQRLAELEEGQT